MKTKRAKRSRALRAQSRNVGGGSVHPRVRRGRIKLIGVITVFWTAIVVARLASLQITDFETWRDWSQKQHSQAITLASERGPVLDREGKALALSVPSSSVFARPREIRDKEGTARVLSGLMGLPSKQILVKLEGSEPFVWIKRQVPRSIGLKVEAEKVPGVGQLLEAKRVYPYGQAASTLIGRVGIDGNGLSGLEASYDDLLRTAAVKRQVNRDALGQTIAFDSGGGGAMELPKGKDLKLTLDAELQLILNDELDSSRAKYNAKATMGIMVDAGTGEILAMGQSPEANFNAPVVNSKDSLRNLVIESVFEPGSVMKPIVAAAAIDAGLMSANQLVDCEHGRYFFAGHTIKDVHPSQVIPLKDVVIRSSNIGMTKVGMRLGRERLYDALRRFGFGQSSGLKLPGETGGLFRPLNRWAQIDIATHAYGQGIAVTPLQMVRAISAIANGGLLPTLHVLEDGQSSDLTRVISEKAARDVQEMLFGVVEDEHGTGRLAAIPGVRIGGKTGTAQKARSGGRGYEPGAYVASFVGFADASKIGIGRKIALMIAVDEAKADSIYGGTLAGPVFQRVMGRALRLLSTRSELAGADTKSEDINEQTQGPRLFTEIAYHP